MSVLFPDSSRCCLNSSLLCLKDSRAASYSLVSADDGDIGIFMAPGSVILSPVATVGGSAFAGDSGRAGNGVEPWEQVLLCELVEGLAIFLRTRGLGTGRWLQIRFANTQCKFVIMIVMQGCTQGVWTNTKVDIRHCAHTHYALRVRIKLTIVSCN